MKPTKEQLADNHWIKENAPEGATHFLYDTTECSSCFVKVENGEYYYSYGLTCVWKYWANGKEYCTHAVLLGSSSWNGPQDGLPPVGTVCEMYVERPHEHYAHHNGKKVTIIAHTKDSDDGLDIAVYHVVVDDGSDEYHGLVKDCFRPIQPDTEQLVEDEYEKDVSVVAQIIMENYDDPREERIARLIVDYMRSKQSSTSPEDMTMREAYL